MEESLSMYIQSSNCIIGDKDHLYDRLKRSIKSAKKVDLIVAFLMESGVRLLVDDFSDAVKNGAAIRILCGNYLNITQPQALYLLKASIVDYMRPRGPQIEALYELKRAHLDGLDKALVVAATGECVMIVMGAVCVIKSRVSGTLTKYISCIA